MTTRRAALRPRLSSCLAVFAAVCAPSLAWAQPWSPPGAVPLSDVIASAVALHEDDPLQSLPSAGSTRRGSVYGGSRLPVYAVQDGPGCPNGWLMVGPMAWICKSRVELSEGPPMTALETPKEPPDGLPYSYFFVQRGGSAGYKRLEFAEMAEPDMDLQGGFGVAIVQEKNRTGEPFGLSHHGLWIPMRDLIPVRPTPFRGEAIKEGKLDVAWVVDDRAPLFDKPGGKQVEKLPRFFVLHVAGEDKTHFVLADGRAIQKKHVRKPTSEAVPGEVMKGERWIDVELATQTLVAYEGETPVFATLVSTGKGKQGTALATPKGTHRIWVKLRSSTMDNLEDQNATNVYAIEDVPYVQFFSKGVALHGAFWHSAFGRVRSHGCVNLSPMDAQRLYAFTGPKVAAGWSAALPVEFDRGTVVRVR